MTLLERLSRSPVLLGALMLASAIIGGSMVAATQWLRPAAQGATDIRGYLLAHPQVLRETMEKLQQVETVEQAKQAEQQVSANRDEILDPFAGAWTGNAKGNLTIAIYTDYACGFCRASLPELDELVAGDPNLRIVYREWPILGDNSTIAAAWGLAAAEQGPDRYRAFHHALFTAGQLSQASLDGAIASAGIDRARAEKMIESKAVQDEIATNEEIAKQIGANGTPTWVIGDQVISGAVGLDQLRKAIAEARNG